MTNFFFDFKSYFILGFLFLAIFVFGKKIIATFAVLLGVLCFFCMAEIKPYEPDMYNNSAGKR